MDEREELARMMHPDAWTYEFAPGHKPGQGCADCDGLRNDALREADRILAALHQHQSAEGARDVSPWLLVRCDGCHEEANCHPIGELRWSVVMGGYSGVKPEPVCSDCWESAQQDHPDADIPDWETLERIAMPAPIAPDSGEPT